MSYNPTPNSSWAWRMICKVKEKFKPAYMSNMWQSNAEKYLIADGYKWLSTGNDQKVTWKTVVWNRYNVPKHVFIMWLIQQQRLLTMDRLQKMGICEAGLCFLCDQCPKSHQHLFEDCPYIVACFNILFGWLGIINSGLKTGEALLAGRRQPPLIRLLKCSVVVGLYYHVWMVRNSCRMEMYVPRPDCLIQRIRDDIKL
ncbi:uncharacterized protein LOC141649271 [Silene latifolia]|uniref:uncharacterized protein LOC141649271 n=1 Tax=Silene latifolia TaxID=37657 RepID=UPI003D784FA0